jgi:hypothetical protein
VAALIRAELPADRIAPGTGSDPSFVKLTLSLKITGHLSSHIGRSLTTNPNCASRFGTIVSTCFDWCVQQKPECCQYRALYANCLAIKCCSYPDPGLNIASSFGTMVSLMCRA